MGSRRLVAEKWQVWRCWRTLEEGKPVDAADAQATAIRLALQAWDAVIAPSLVETDDLTNTGQIRIAFTDVNDTTGNEETTALAYRPPQPGYALAAFAG